MTARSPSEIRAITLSALGPRRGELLWDVGAGAGSVAIEWMLADPSMRAVALEARGERAARIRRNAAAFGVPALEIVEGKAPAAFDGLAQPDAVFVGGGASDAGLLDAAMDALRPGGRLVVNAVTLEAEATLLACPRGLAVEGLAASSSGLRLRARSRSGAWRLGVPRCH
jgi:precorrin-6Y C5,15-methyltransferase (decarboxylating), CbiT subunit